MELCSVVKLQISKFECEYDIILTKPAEAQKSKISIFPPDWMQSNIWNIWLAGTVPSLLLPPTSGTYISDFNDLPSFKSQHIFFEWPLMFNYSFMSLIILPPCFLLFTSSHFDGFQDFLFVKRPWRLWKALLKIKCFFMIIFKVNGYHTTLLPPPRWEPWFRSRRFYFPPVWRAKKRLVRSDSVCLRERVNETTAARNKRTH